MTSSTVLKILNCDSMPVNLNNNFIVLIPRKSKSEHMSEFHPIAFCNMVYKLVSNVLANKLKKKILPDIIFVNQSALSQGG